MRALVALATAVILVAGLAAPALAARPPEAGKPGGGGGGGGGGKPGYPDRIAWSGETWQIKTSNSRVGPGPNYFAKGSVGVEADGTLRLEIANRNGRWECAEIILDRSLGYGTYTFELASDVSALDPNVVLGLFTWSDKAQQNHREIDIEFAKWGNAADSTNAQYVVQPHTRPGNLERFTMGPVAPTIHSFTWTRDRIEFESRAGTTIIRAWSYSGPDVPTDGDEAVRLNLWLFGGSAPSDGQPVTIRVRSFSYTPLG